MLWPLMDDRQKLKYVRYANKFVGQTTSDGCGRPGSDW
jgi:hypothetical protein